MNAERGRRWIWVDGEMVEWERATTHVSELQWSGVGSVFEGVRSYFDDGVANVFGLDAHLRRLGRSMRMLGMEGIETATLREATLEVVRRNACRTDEYIRIFVWYHEGWNYTTRQSIHAFATSRPFPSSLGSNVVWSAGVSTWRRLDDASFPARAKAVANYQNSRVAGVEASRLGFDFAVLLNARGEVAEGPRECIFLVEDGAIVTAPLSAGVLDSITRRTVMLLAEHLGIRVIERPVMRAELHEAGEMFTAATASEITPIGSIEGAAIGAGAPGPVTRRIRDLYTDVVYAKTSLLDDMRVPVRIS